MPANPEIEAFIRQEAIKRGIDPNVAVKVARTEALNVFDPSKPDYGGDEGSSFGPFQLHYAGYSKKMPHPGLGDAFTRATGLHASNPSTWREQVQFALDTAAKDGWRQWMGAANNQIPRWAGIKDAKQLGVTLTNTPVASTTNYPASSITPDQPATVNTSPFNQPGPAGVLGTAVAGGAGAGAGGTTAATSTTDAATKEMSFGEKLMADLNSKDSVLGEIFKSIKPQQQEASTADQIIPSSLGASVKDPTMTASAAALMQKLLSMSPANKRFGMSLTGMM
jgi:hypothetical protein